MRKKFLTALGIILILATMVAVLCACDENDEEEVTVTSITFENADNLVRYMEDDFNLEQVTVVINFSDGTVLKKPLSQGMIAEKCEWMLFTEGKRSIPITYEGATGYLSVDVRSRDTDHVYLAQFFSNGGSDIPTQETGVITKFRSPTKEGFTFLGWYATSDFSGSRAVAPYTLSRNTDFYAKWEDNRRCTITFRGYDGETLYEKVIVYGTGIDLNDRENCPAPDEESVPEGYRFTGWVANGSTEVITSDIDVDAAFDRITCNVRIWTYIDDDGTENYNSYPLFWGQTFDVKSVTMPTRDGHVTRYVMFRTDPQYRPDSPGEFPDGYEELPEDKVITVTDERIWILPLHVINTYTVTIQNGMRNQTEADLRSGNIRLENMIDSSTGREYYSRNWDSDFRIREMIQEELNVPRAITGYNAQWCFVVTDADGNEVIYNANNKIWDPKLEEFVGEDGITSFDLTDSSGNYIARITGGNVSSIKGNVVIRAFYRKEKYTVNMRRNINGGWSLIKDCSFTVEYYTEFNPYDPTLPEYVGIDSKGLTLDTPENIKLFYLLNRVPEFSRDADVVDKWESVYTRFYEGYAEDWDISWYDNSNTVTADPLEFENPETTYTIFGDMDFYGVDIDYRRYSVTFVYDYQFDYDRADPTYSSSENYTRYGYKQTTVVQNLGESTAIANPPAPSPIRRDISKTAGDSDWFKASTTLTYTFSGWYDYPYDPTTEDAYEGNFYDNSTVYERRTRNMVYYAHYENKLTGTIIVHDRTQSAAYSSLKGYEDEGFDVQENTMMFTVAAGELFGLNDLYKGAMNGDNLILGSTYAEQAKFIEKFNDPDPEKGIKAVYELLIAGNGGTAELALSNLTAQRNAVNDIITNYNKLLAAMYSYDYADLPDGEFTKEFFNKYYLDVYEYNEKLKERKDLDNKIAKLNSYKTEKETYDNYVKLDEDYKARYMSLYPDAYPFDGGAPSLYKKFADSDRDLNAAYGYYDTEAGRKYRFSGWYADDTYTNQFGDANGMEFFVLMNDQTEVHLYARWADEEKGTEGLVFRKVEYGGQIGVVVVDFLDSAQYNESVYSGCGYGFATGNYSVNLNDIGLMPNSLGTNIELQIPSYHGGENDAPYPVLGVLKGAFALNGGLIKTVMLPERLAFIEEGAFMNVMAETISGVGSDNEYLKIYEDRVVYQAKEYSLKIDNKDDKYSGGTYPATVLVAYAALNPATTLDITLIEEGVTANTVRIADYAAFNATNLQYVRFGEFLETIGTSAFENADIHGSYESVERDGSGAETVTGGSTTLVLPDSLADIGEEAFENNRAIENIDIGTGSRLSHVGRNALKDSTWFNNKNERVGVIAINGLMIGISEAMQENFDKNGDAAKITELDGRSFYTCTNEYGALYYEISDASGGLKLVFVELTDKVVGVSDYSFETVAASLERVTINGALEKGIMINAFEGCQNLADLYLTAISSTSEIASSGFNGCGRVNVHTSGRTLHESWHNLETSGNISLVTD